MEFIAQYGASDSEEEQFSMSTQVFYKSKTVTPKLNSLSIVQYKDSKPISPKPQKNKKKFDSHEVDDLQSPKRMKSPNSYSTPQNRKEVLYT